MNRFVARGLALALFIVAVSPAFAQRQPGGGFGFGGFGGEKGIAQLVTNKSVQEELKLTDDQVAKFKTASEEVREKFKTEFKDAGKDREKMTALFKTMNEESTKVMTKLVDEALKPDQAKRLKQIKWQVNGTRTLVSDTEVQKTLKLSESQIGEIKAINEDAQKDAAEVRKGAGKDADKRAEATKKVAEINKDANEKGLGKLTPEQKKQWEEITGPKFELKEERRGPRPSL